MGKSQDVAVESTISSLLFLGSEELDLNQLGEPELEKIISLFRNEDVKKVKA